MTAVSLVLAVLLWRARLSFVGRLGPSPRAACAGPVVLFQEIMLNSLGDLIRLAVRDDERGRRRVMRLLLVLRLMLSVLNHLQHADHRRDHHQKDH